VPKPQDRLSISQIRAHEWYQQAKVREYPGIIIGKDPIPVDMDLVNRIPEIESCDVQQARRHVANFRHNNITTIYYLLLKKHLRDGGESVADLLKYRPEDFKPGGPRYQGRQRLLNISMFIQKRGQESVLNAVNRQHKLATSIKLKKDFMKRPSEAGALAKSMAGPNSTVARAMEQVRMGRDPVSRAGRMAVQANKNASADARNTGETKSTDTRNHRHGEAYGSTSSMPTNDYDMKKSVVAPVMRQSMPTTVKEHAGERRRQSQPPVMPNPKNM
jgi:hypothetical protein